MMPWVSAGVALISHAYGQSIYPKSDRSHSIGSPIRKAGPYPKEDFVVWGDGSQRRCFVYVSDAVDALFRLYDHVGRNGSTTVNVGTNEEVTVRELAGMTIGLSKKEIPLKFDVSKPTGALNRMPDLERVKKVLDWSPTTRFAEGLERTYAWAQSRLTSG